MKLPKRSSEQWLPQSTHRWPEHCFMSLCTHWCIHLFIHSLTQQMGPECLLCENHLLPTEDEEGNNSFPQRIHSSKGDK